jgi:hypothetical protein
MNKRFEVLDRLPAYGPMYIPVTKSGHPYYSEGFVVRFFRINDNSWVANFERSFGELDTVIELDNTTDILVIAGGLCYIIDVNSTKPKDVFGHFTLFIKTNTGTVVLANSTSLTFIESDGTLWNSINMSWDGIIDIRFYTDEENNSIVTGLSYDPFNDNDEWVPFSYNISKEELTGGSRQRYQKASVKPWWKFWA